MPRRLSVGRWYSFVKMQGKVASKMPRIVVVSQNSIDDIHTDMGVDIDDQPRYIGRIGLRDSNHDVLLIDWRARSVAASSASTS